MNAAEPASQGERCPVCGKPADAHVKPFCSSRCRNVDLNRWLKGSYAIPAADDDDDSAASGDDPSGEGR